MKMSNQTFIQLLCSRFIGRQMWRQRASVLMVNQEITNHRAPEASRTCSQNTIILPVLSTNVVGCVYGGGYRAHIMK